MLGDKFKVKKIENSFEITNITGDLLENCLVYVNNIFSKDIIRHVVDFLPDESKTFQIPEFNFSAETINEVMAVKVFHNYKLSYEKTFNDKTKCFVLLSNKSFEKLTEQLIIGLTRYSNVDILHYTIDYKSELEYDNLTNIEFSINGDSTDIRYMQFAKPSVLLDILEMGYAAGVFLDSDIQVKSNINSLFNYISEIEDGPIFNKGYWDFTCVNGMYIPGPLLKEALGDIPTQCAPQGITNVLIFNKTHKDLFKEWEAACFSEPVIKIKEIEFLHDELILNCLQWKKGVTPKQKWLAINIKSYDDVVFSYNHNFNSYDDVDLTTYNKGWAYQSFIPYDKESIIGFHCIKDAAVAEDVNKLIYKKEISNNFEEDLLDFYKDIKKSDVRINKIEEKVSVVNHFVKGPYVEIRGRGEDKFLVKFINKDGQTTYANELGYGMWARAGVKYFEEYTCEVYRKSNNELIHKETFNATGKRVYVALDSSSLGDTLAWMPYAEEFRKKHGCKMLLSTFMNDLFIDQYPEIEFVKPGTNVDNLYAMYTIGWYYNDEDSSVDLSRNPKEFKNLPMQQTASDILGLEYKEVKPLLKIPNVAKKKKVGIGFHSTAQPKYWNNPLGWQEVVDYLNSQNYEVVVYSKEGDGYMGNYLPKGVKRFEPTTLQNLMVDMAECEFFIGIGSGLSWLAWSLNVPVVLISGFSEAYCEPVEGITRVINESPDICRGCFNIFRLDAGDWNWCPNHKGTDRQFECTKTITGEMVINKIKQLK